MNWKKILGLVAVGVVVVAGVVYAWHELGQKPGQKEKQGMLKIDDKYGLILSQHPFPPIVENGELPENVLDAFNEYHSLVTYAGFDNVKKVYGGTLEDLGEWSHKISKKAGEEDFAFMMIDPGHGVPNSTDLGSYEDIDKALKPLNKENIPTGIVIDTCYSGSGIDELEADRRFIMTSTSENRLSGNWSDLGTYMPKTYEPWKFTHNPYDPDKFRMPPLYSLDADIHPKDGQLTALELFKFAEYNMEKFHNETESKLPENVAHLVPGKPQLWDPENLAGKIDMGEAVPYQGENLGSRYKGENKG